MVCLGVIRMLITMSEKDIQRPPPSEMHHSYILTSHQIL
ncbi:hypothetical protein VCRA2120E57_880001 [Vibrio crassostreae]|nr:hypothetical protein VCRA2120E57_880001 [Vibrio crassostreae]